MADNHVDEAVELEFSEEDVAYYIVDENDVEIGIALYDEEGNEVEYYYAEDAAGEPDADDGLDGDVAFELEFSEEDVAYYIVDEEGNEIGFALTEDDGTETEYYYDGIDASAYEPIEDPEAQLAASDAATAASPSPAEPPKPAKPVPFAKRAGQEVGKLSTRAGVQASKAAAAAKSTVQNIKDGKPLKPDDDEDLGFGITASGVKKAAGEFNTIAKEGAETAAELKEVYNDIFGNLDFLKPSATSRTTRR